MALLGASLFEYQENVKGLDWSGKPANAVLNNYMAAEQEPPLQLEQLLVPALKSHEPE